MAAAVPEFERNAYQKAARTVLMNPLTTEIYPNVEALPLVRRWATPLADDLSQLFGYRLEMTPGTARLLRINDALDATHPALTDSTPARAFDRQRYAYLALAIAVLGRSGTQLSLSELAERVSAETARIDGLRSSSEKIADRAAFVDAIGWLQTRGAIRLADGNAKRWADDPSAGEALSDIDRDVIRALYRPTRVLQHIDSVTGLLARSEAVSRDTFRRESAQRVRRRLVEHPVAYYDALDAADRGTLRNLSAAADVAQLTGMMIERRAEGVALLDVSGSFSDRRFPGTGTVAQVALLLANVIADRVLDVDAPELNQLAAPEPDGSGLTASLDLALPRSAASAESDPADDRAPSAEEPDEEPESYPLLEQGWLRHAVENLLRDYGSTFAAVWSVDPKRLTHAAVTLLAELSLVVVVPGGVLALPLLARYRNASIKINRRSGQGDVSLFDL